MWRIADVLKLLRFALRIRCKAVCEVTVGNNSTADGLRSFKCCVSNKVYNMLRKFEEGLLKHDQMLSETE